MGPSRSCHTVALPRPLGKTRDCFCVWHSKGCTILGIQKGGTIVGKNKIYEGSLATFFWFGGWLFTLAFAKLLWWQAILGLVIWPYYLGLTLR